MSSTIFPSLPPIDSTDEAPWVNLDALLGVGLGGLGLIVTLGFVGFILTVVGTVKLSKLSNAGQRGDLIALLVISWLFMSAPVVGILPPAILVGMLNSEAA
jgi:hypothetical protein